MNESVQPVARFALVKQLSQGMRCISGLASGAMRFSVYSFWLPPCATYYSGHHCTMPTIRTQPRNVLAFLPLITLFLAQITK